MKDQLVLFLTSEKFSPYRNALAVLGAAYVLRSVVRTIWSVARGFCTYVLAPLGVSRISLTKYGSWAIVTGASEGIGRAYAIELAKRGLNVVIMSRSEEKLKTVADEIKERYGREVRYFSVDFSQGQSVYDDIQAEISDLDDVAVLVNNVGVGVDYPAVTGEVDEMQHRKIVEVNCQAVVQMTHLVLPKMVEKKRGIIVNISSMTSFQPTPLLNVYSASKIFIDYFSDSLRYEYKSKGIVVQCVLPGLVATAMADTISSGLFSPSPETFARSAVATIGVQRKTTGYPFHTLQHWISKFIPAGIVTRMLYSALMQIRNDKLRKIGKKKN